MTKQAPTITKLPKQRPGESNRDYEKRLMAFVHGEDVRSKTDLKDWTGSPPFHLDNQK